ncbi:MAG: hypothetical protein RMJ98_20710 [Myxococcales bacterium]|nr:hypothetical protein [Polyangiaceae bacterium]MDW8251725.1 hypothetical protein [Myxococcales bacterium]
MKTIARHVREKARHLASHPLFTEWLEDPTLPPEQAFLFSPMAIDFVMGFRDLNLYWIIYPQPSNALEEGLNAHAREDATHSRLFLKDWVALGLDEQLGWAPRDLYWWQTSEATFEGRRADFELTRMVFENPDPLLRFAIIESMEEAGNVFFRRTVPIIERLAARTGLDYPYYGRYHLHRETGHLQNADERAFYGVTLPEDRRSTAVRLVDRVFAIFDLHFTSWLGLARARRDGSWRFEPAREGRANASLRPDRPKDVSHTFSFHHPSSPSGEWAALARARTEAFASLWEAPFNVWLRSAPPGDFERVARIVLLQWVVDSWACADWFLLDTTYATPSTPLERGINRLSRLYASEMNRRYVEWEHLRIDEVTGWSASQALAHFWLDERVEEMRAVFASLRRLTFRFPQPLYRYWIMKCFVRFGDAMMHSLGEALRRSGVPEESFPAFTGCAERLHPDLPPDREADEAIESIESSPLAETDAAILWEILEETRAQEAKRLAVSWSVVEEAPDNRNLRFPVRQGKP